MVGRKRSICTASMMTLTPRSFSRLKYSQNSSLAARPTCQGRSSRSRLGRPQKYGKTFMSVARAISIRRRRSSNRASTGRTAAAPSMSTASSSWMKSYPKGSRGRSRTLGQRGCLTSKSMRRLPLRCACLTLNRSKVPLESRIRSSYLSGNIIRSRTWNNLGINNLTALLSKLSRQTGYCTKRHKSRSTQ